jgi:hypothetical protein
MARWDRGDRLWGLTVYHPGDPRKPRETQQGRPATGQR